MHRLEGRGVSLVPLLLRLPLASVFLFAGWPKLADLAGAAALFGRFGLPGWVGRKRKKGPTYARRVGEAYTMLVV